MNKKGFTLAELLGVVIVLGVLLLLVVTPIVNNINNQGSKIDELTINLLYSTVETYMDKQGGNYKPINGNVYYIPVKHLIDTNILEKKVISSDAWTKIDEQAQIKITVENGNYNYELINTESRYSNNLINKAKRLSTSTVMQNGNTYYTNNVLNNYVSYSGLLWKIIAINNDQSVRLILEEDITTLIPSDGISDYKSSYVRKWLNEEFYSKLTNNDLIEKGTFCLDKASGNTSSNAICSDNINDYVGLLSLYEINAGLNKDLIGNYSDFITLTYNSTDNSQLYSFSNSKSITNYSATSFQYIRPIINLEGTSFIIKGNGAQNNPYLIAKSTDYTKVTNTKKSDLQTGSYIKFGKADLTYRVIEYNEDYIKVISTAPVSQDVFASTNKFDRYNGLGLYLNHYYISEFFPLPGQQEKLLNNKIYISDFVNTNMEYSISYSKDKYLVENALIGLPRLGELFTAPECVTSTCSSSFMTMTMNNPSYIYTINQYTPSINVVTQQLGVRTVFYLENNLKITSGEGTLSNPLQLAA